MSINTKMQPDGHSFRVLTYNILARSLGSNTIPWVLNVSPQTRARIEDKTGEAFGAWRKTNVDEEYKRHWHKNFHSGDYAAMRALWWVARRERLVHSVCCCLGG